MTYVDWERIARNLGSIRDECSGNVSQWSDTALAREAIAVILGEDVLRDAVDHYVAWQPGFELARFVLWLLHPWVAMQRCYEIYKSSADVEVRRRAIELLRVVGDRRALPWLDELLRDSDPEIQVWAVGLLDQLAWSELISSEEAYSVLDMLRAHPNADVREKVGFIEEYLSNERRP